jgi:hypothetical protein
MLEIERKKRKGEIEKEVIKRREEEERRKMGKQEKGKRTEE